MWCCEICLDFFTPHLIGFSKSMWGIFFNKSDTDAMMHQKPAVQSSIGFSTIKGLILSVVCGKVMEHSQFCIWDSVGAAYNQCLWKCKGCKRCPEISGSLQEGCEFSGCRAELSEHEGH